MYLPENALEILCKEGGRRFEQKINSLKPFLEFNN